MGEKVVKEWCHLDLGVWKSKLPKYKPKWLPCERHTAKSKSKLKQTKEVSPKVGFNLWAIPSVCSVACHAQCLPQSGQFDLQDKSWIGCNKKDSACGLKSIDLWTRGGHFIAVQQSIRIARIATFWHLPTNQPTKYNRNFNSSYYYFNSHTLVQNVTNFTTSCRTLTSFLSRKYFAKETVLFDIFLP